MDKFITIQIDGDEIQIAAAEGDGFTLEEIARCTAAYMDFVAANPRVKENPMMILQAIQRAMMG